MILVRKERQNCLHAYPSIQIKCSFGLIHQPFLLPLTLFVIFLYSILTVTYPISRWRIFTSELTKLWEYTTELHVVFTKGYVPHFSLAFSGVYQRLKFCIHMKGLIWAVFYLKRVKLNIWLKGERVKMG